MNDTMTAPETAQETAANAPQNAADAPQTPAQLPQPVDAGPAPLPERKPQNAPQYPPEYAIYKPNGRGNGGVVRFNLSRSKFCVFVEAANQSGDRQFDWESKIIMKWAVPDLGAVLAVLQARQPEAKLFHRTEKANTAFQLNRQKDPERAPYLLSISRQDATDKSVRKTTIPLTHSEAAILESALRTAITRVIGW